MKTHYRIENLDARSAGQTEHEFSHQTARGYVRDDVSRNGDVVDCKLCLKSAGMKDYHAINEMFTDSQGCY